MSWCDLNLTTDLAVVTLKYLVALFTVEPYTALSRNLLG